MSIDRGAALANALPFPLGHVPTWSIVNADDPISLPLMGQFEPQVKRSHGDPIWVKKPGILGGQGWLRYVGRNLETLKFTFHAISNNVLDFYPSAAWDRLQELSRLDPTLGRPPRVYFVYGLTIVQGYITAVPEAPFDHWPNTRLPREIGPVEIEITLVPGEETVLSISTNYVVMTEDTLFEDLAKTQYGDAMYGPSLAELNQGMVVGDTLSIPRKSYPGISKRVDVAPMFDIEDVIEGL